MILTLAVKKVFDKTQHSFMVKVLESSGIHGAYRNIIKAVYSKSIVNKLNGEKLEANLLTQGLFKAAYSLHNYSIQYLKFQPEQLDNKKEVKGIKVGKK